MASACMIPDYQSLPVLLVSVTVVQLLEFGSSTEQKDRNLNHNGGNKKSQPSLFDDRTAVDLNEILISITYQWQPFLHIRCLISEVKRSSTQREIT